MLEALDGTEDVSRTLISAIGVGTRIQFLAATSAWYSPCSCGFLDSEWQMGDFCLISPFSLYSPLNFLSLSVSLSLFLSLLLLCLSGK